MTDDKDDKVLGQDAVLGIFGEETIGELTVRQQDFLIARTRYPTDLRARKVTKVSKRDLNKWLQEPNFRAAYDLIIGDPVEFGRKTIREIMARATIKHLILLEHTNVKVVQWAVRLAYEAAGMLSQHIQAEISSGTPFETLKEVYEQGLRDGHEGTDSTHDEDAAKRLADGEVESRALPRAMGLDNRPARDGDISVPAVGLPEGARREVPGV